MKDGEHDAARSDSLQITTFALVSTIGNACVARPIADPALSAFGTREDALSELAVFLEDMLSKASPDTLARYSLPSGVTLRRTAARLPRADTPQRARWEWEVDVPYVTLPAQDDRWAVIFPVAHTLFLSPDEDADAAVAEEARRVVGAFEMAGAQWLGLLPADDVTLEPLTVSVKAGQAAPARRKLRMKLVEAERRRTARKRLEEVGEPLHLDSAPAPALHERGAEQRALRALLSGGVRTSVLIVGEDQSGRSALVRDYARGWSEDRNGTRLVFATSGAQLIAGMTGFGQWEQRLREVMEAAEVLDAVLFFDDVTDLFGAEANNAKEIDIPSAMRPYLASGRVRIVAEVSESALETLQHRHVSFFGALQRLRVAPLSAAETTQALAAYIGWRAQHAPHRVQASPDVAAAIVDLTERYAPYEAFPGKAMRLLLELLGALQREGDAEHTVLNVSDVFEAMALRTGMPTFLLDREAPVRAAELERRLSARLVGQREAVRCVAETLCTVKSGMQPGDKPLGTFLFVGPTGVGKTELARALATLLFGSPSRLIRFDMSEYADGFAAERLISGTGTDDGLMTSAVRRTPFSVLLLDEIEKAHPTVFDLLLQVTGEGRLSDARGRTAFFHNTIIIMTSNVGAAHRGRTIGLTRVEPTDRERFVAAVERHFRPEFVNRIDRVVPFSPIGRDEARKILDLVLIKCAGRHGLVQAELGLDVDSAARDLLLERGFSAQYGARALRREVDESVMNPIARLLCEHGAQAAGGSVHVARDPEGDELTVRLRPGQRRGAALHMNPLGEVSAIRREMRRQLNFDTVVEVQERIALLLAQLSAAPKKRASRQQAEMGRMTAEHSLLSELYAPAKAALADVQTLEELAFFEDDPATGGDLVHQARALRSEFRDCLRRLLWVRETHANSVTLYLAELDKRGGLVEWLRGMQELWQGMGVGARFYVRAGVTATPDEWPKGRPYTPCEPAELTRLLGEADRNSLRMIVELTGRDAGLFRLESGLIRFRIENKENLPAHLQVMVLSHRPLTARDWKSSRLTPSSPPDDQLALLPCVRDVFPNEASVNLCHNRVTVHVDVGRYADAFPTLALEHLILFETDSAFDRDVLLTQLLEKDDA